MTQIDNITDSANQLIQVVLDDGSEVQIILVYRPATQRWTMDISHEKLTTTNVSVCNYPNMLRQWRNLIPFGIACATVSGQDPVDIEDFVNGNATLYALNAADVLGVEANVFDGVLH